MGVIFADCEDGKRADYVLEHLEGEREEFLLLSSLLFCIRASHLELDL